MADTNLDTLAQVAGQITSATMAGQEAGLHMLLAEMQALSVMLPGAALLPQPPKTDAERAAEEAATEADFDNMPV